MKLLHPDLQFATAGNVGHSAGGYKGAQALYLATPKLGWDQAAYKTRDGFVAWPPKGYCPAALVFRKWSFAIYTGKDVPAADLHNAVVSMTRNGPPIPVTRVDSKTAVNRVVWEPNDEAVFALADRLYHPRGDITFEVTISNALPEQPVFNCTVPRCSGATGCPLATITPGA